MKSPLLLSTESHEHSSITCSSVFPVIALSIFSFLGEFSYMGLICENVPRNRVCFYCLCVPIAEVERLGSLAGVPPI